MKEFPSILRVRNIEKFSDIYYSRVLCYLRKVIYEHVISHDENSYFDIQKFCCEYYKKETSNITSRLAESIIPELELLGWKCKLSFGGTALFIFSTETSPPSCWDDGL
jgi:hypothetical protein